MGSRFQGCHAFRMGPRRPRPCAHLSLLRRKQGFQGDAEQPWKAPCIPAAVVPHLDLHAHSERFLHSKLCVSSQQDVARGKRTKYTSQYTSRVHIPCAHPRKYLETPLELEATKRDTDVSVCQPHVVTVTRRCHCVLTREEVRLLSQLYRGIVDTQPGVRLLCVVWRFDARSVNTPFASLEHVFQWEESTGDVSSLGPTLRI